MTVTASTQSSENSIESKCGKVEKRPNILLRDKHEKFFKQMLNLLPEAYESHDSSRLTLLYFSLSG